MNFFPFRPCLDRWSVGGDDELNCTLKPMSYNDLPKPCKLFAKELLYDKELNKDNPNQAQYDLQDLDSLARASGAPTTIIFKVHIKNKYRENEIVQMGCKA